MATEKGKLDSGLAPSQPRLLGSRKTDYQSHDISLRVDCEAIVHQKDTAGNNMVVITPLQCPESPLQECATITTLELEQSYLTKHDESTEEQHAETLKTSEEQENSAPYHNIDSQLQDSIIHHESDTDNKEKEEIHLQEVTRLESIICTDQDHTPTSEDAGGSCAAAFELDPKKNLHCNLGENHESTQEEPTNMFVDDVKEIAKESALGLPVRKKRRMGMCGLTDRERSHFLQTQKHDNGHDGVERVEKQLCKNTTEVVAQEENTSEKHLQSSPLPILIDTVIVEGKEEVKLLSSHCGGDNRAETEHTALGGTSALCYPGYSGGKTSETEGSKVPDPEPTDEPTSNQPAEEKVERYLGKLEQQEHEEIKGEIPVKQRTDIDDASSGLDCVPVITFYTNPSWNDAIEEKRNGSEAAPLQVCEPRTRDQMMDDTGAEAGAPSTDPQSRELNCSYVEMCGVEVTPRISEKKDDCASDLEHAAGSSTMNTEHTMTGDTTDPFGSQYLDSVSDSQLNSIAVIEEERMEREKYPGSSNCPKDATNLICGLIWELASLNQKVMATHRELENLRRGSKSSRSSIRKGCGY